jgi:hypothetical protein
MPPKRTIETTRPTPEQFLAAFPPKIRAIANQLRSLVEATLPNVIEAVYPGWKLIGYRIKAEGKSHYLGFIAPLADHVGLGFEHGVLLSDPDGLLEGDGKQVRQVVIRHARDIKAAALAALITEAAQVALTPKNKLLSLLLERDAEQKFRAKTQANSFARRKIKATS